MFKKMIFFIVKYIIINVIIYIYWTDASLRKTIRELNSLDPDQDQCLVEPGLGPNCLKR